MPANRHRRSSNRVRAQQPDGREVVGVVATEIVKQITPASVVTCVEILDDGQVCDRPLMQLQRYYCSEHAKHTLTDSMDRREQNRINVRNFNERNPELRKARRKVYKVREKFRTRAVPAIQVYMEEPDEAFVYLKGSEWKVPLPLLGNMIPPVRFSATGSPVLFDGRIGFRMPESWLDITWRWAMVPFRGYVFCLLPESDDILTAKVWVHPKSLDFHLLSPINRPTRVGDLSYLCLGQDSSGRDVICYALGPDGTMTLFHDDVAAEVALHRNAVRVTWPSWADARVPFTHYVMRGAEHGPPFEDDPEKTTPPGKVRRTDK